MNTRSQNAQRALLAGSIVLLAPTSDADAKTWIRANGNICSHGQDLTGWNTWDSSLGRLETRTPLSCPLLEQDGLQRDDLTYGSFWLETPQNTVTVQACRMSYSGLTAYCGSAHQLNPSSATQRVALSDLDKSRWQNTTGTAYFHIDSPTLNTSASVTMRGYYMENDNSTAPTSSFRGQSAWCRTEDSSDWQYDFLESQNPELDRNGSDGNNAGYFFSGTDSAITLICPLIEQSGIQRDDLTSITVYGSDRSSTTDMEVQLCRTSFTGSSYCGAASTITTQNESLNINELDTSTWSNTTGTAYIKAEIPRSTSSVRSYFQGFYIAHN